VCATSSRTSSQKRRLRRRFCELEREEVAHSRAEAHLTALSVMFNWLPSSA